MTLHRRALATLLIVACDSSGDQASSRLDTTSAEDPSDAASQDTASAEDSAEDSAAPHDAAAETSPDALLDTAPPVVCGRWNEDRAQRAEGSWSGSVAECEAGAYAEPGPSNTLRQVNLFRWLAGLPPVELSADRSAAAQACALLMHANRELEHEVPASWSCWSSASASAAGLSNLATTASVRAIDLYMTDQGIRELGHRRWILSNTLGPIGVGSTSSYSCLHVISGDGRADARWVAWPPPGEVPIQALYMATWLDTDAAGWSVQSDFVDLRRGEVSVTRAGEPLAIETWVLAQGYGSTFGLGIRPLGWRSEVGETYDVIVSGVSEPIEWSFTVVDCR
jgi:uncharacterized protein YkwD